MVRVLTQFIAAADRVHAVTHFGDDAFEPDLASMGKHRAPVDLKTLAKLVPASARLHRGAAAGLGVRQLHRDGGVADLDRLRPRLVARHFRRLHHRPHPGSDRAEQSRA
jgi:hypothetical protein